MPDRWSRLIARVLRLRLVVLACYAVAVPPAVIAALRIPSEGAIDRLVVPSDPDYAATRAFQAIFPEPQIGLLVLETPAPWSQAALARLGVIEAAVRRVPGATAFSAVDALRRVRPDASPELLAQLATGTAFFHRQGLVGPDYLTVIVNLAVHGPAQRDAMLAAIDRELARAGASDVRRVGGPYITSWLEHAASSATTRSFAVFGVLLVAVTWFLYRSWRALAAIVVALGVAVVVALAAGAGLGFTFTIVSSLVPLTVMVTTLATLTYLHSRFVDQPPGLPLAEHHVVALRNKLLPVTASTVAAASGFAALAVSKIRPVRELGIWTALGLVIAYVVAYTLFPVLQAVLRTPTVQRVAVRTASYDRISRALPGFTHRHRWVLLIGALAACTAGVIAITGVPGVIAGIPVEVSALSNIDPSTRVARDTRWFREHVMDLNIARVWIKLPGPTATDPEVLRAVDQLQTALDGLEGITSVSGPLTVFRLRNYLAGRGERLPPDPGAFAEAVGDVEQLALTQPDLRTFLDVGTLANLQLTVLFRSGGAAGYQAVARRIDSAWAALRAASPALAGAHMHVVGESMLQAKVGANLVPTLAQSFALTVVLILIVFVVIFRNAVERLAAMLPSVVALLVAFLGLRLTGGALNVATIIIATTVLGTTENDQLHFFHHMHERAGDPLEGRLRHALRVAGRAVAFATLINAVGFLGLATSRFPPLREFGIMTASAFVVALVADFTVLPAALWIASRERPA